MIASILSLFMQHACTQTYTTHTHTHKYIHTYIHTKTKYVHTGMFNTDAHTLEVSQPLLLLFVGPDGSPTHCNSSNSSWVAVGHRTPHSQETVLAGLEESYAPGGL